MTIAWSAILLLLVAQNALTPIDEAGYRRLVTSARGKVLLVNFWATWCEPCREEMPEAIKLEKKLRMRGFQLIFVSADEPEQATDALRVLEKNSARRPFYLKRAASNEGFINAIDPKWSGALPALFLYDKAGRKVKSFTGETDIKSIEREIEKLL